MPVRDFVEAPSASSAAEVFVLGHGLFLRAAEICAVGP